MINTGVKQNSINSLQALIASILEDYRLSLEASNKSPKTISWYLEIDRRFLEFLKNTGRLQPINELGREELRSYVIHLQGSIRWPNRTDMEEDRGRLSPASIQGHVRAIKALWSWLASEGYIDGNPLAKYKLPKIPVKVMNILTPKQVEAMLSAIDRDTAIGARNCLIILMLYDCGFRISELVHIKTEDLDIRDDFIRVTGKGQKQRLVPISHITRRGVVRYLNHFRRQLCTTDSLYLFALSDGKPISANGVQQFMRRLAKNAGIINVRCSPHTFRHTFATQFLANGGNVFALKDIMGHSSLQTTLKYTHLQPHDLRNEHARFSPVKNLNVKPSRR